MLIRNTKELHQGPLKMLVYGQSGAGKTTLAKTLPGAPDEIFIISAESGLLPLQGAGIDYVDITRNDKDEVIPKEKRVDRLGEVYTYLQTEPARKKYKWVVFDSLTEIGQCVLDSIMKKHEGSKDKFVVYRENLDKMRNLITVFFRDQIHYSSLILCLSEKGKDQDGLPNIGIDLEGRIAQSAPQFFDCVFFLSISPDGKRSLVTEGNERFIAKDRSGRLAKIEPADLSVVIGKIRGKEEKQAQVTQASLVASPLAGSLVQTTAQGVPAAKGDSK